MVTLGKSELETIKKILVIQLGPFGDGLLTTSYFELLKGRLPQAKLYYLIKEPYHKIVLNHPFIDQLMTIKNLEGIAYFLERFRTIRRVRMEKFDLVIDQQNKPSSQMITFFSGAEYRLGYEDARFHQAYNLKAKRRPIQYSGSRKFDILGPLGLAEERYKIYFQIGEDAHRYMAQWLKNQDLDPANLIVISPGSPIARKEWDLSHYAKLADLIQKNTEFVVILLWGPKERFKVEEVKNLMQTIPLLAPPTNLQQAAALLTKCKLLICNDGGLNHLAVSTETPTLAIFGNTNPSDWSPASKYSHHFHLYHPDFDSSRDQSFGISVEEAFEEVQRIIKLNIR